MECRELQVLAGGITDILYHARAPTTNVIYERAYKKWTQWADRFEEVNNLPADPYHVAIYLTDLAKKAVSFATINIALSALAWAHNLAGIDSPSKSHIVREVVQGIKRKLARPRRPKEPLTIDNIRAIFDILLPESVTDTRNTALIVIAFYALLRFDEIWHLKVSHVRWFESHVEIHIPKAKADQLRLGSQVVVSRLGGQYCPVALLKRYVEMSGSDISDTGNEDNFLFRRCISAKQDIVLTNKILPITYSSVRDIVKKKVKQIGLNEADFGTHSMRAGGATAAANSNIPDRMLQRHGRWASASSRDAYIKDSIERRLEVSQCIGH